MDRTAVPTQTPAHPPAPLTPLGARTPLAHPALYAVIAVLAAVIVVGAAWALWPRPAIAPTPGPSSSDSEISTTERPAVPESWERFDSELVNLSFYHPPGEAYLETDDFAGPRFIEHVGTLAYFTANNGGPGSFTAVSDDFTVVDSVPHDIVEGALDSVDSFKVTVYDDRFTTIRELEDGAFQVTGYGNNECSPFVSSLLIVRPPPGSRLQYIHFFLGVPDNFTATDMLPTDPCTPTDTAIRGRIAAVMEGRVSEVNERLSIAQDIARTFDTTPIGPYALRCSPSDGSPIADWGRTYEWYDEFRDQLMPSWTLVQACYNARTNEVAYLKSKGEPRPENQLGIYHVRYLGGFFSKAPAHAAPLYGGCRIDRWTPATVTYTCRGGDAGIVSEESYRYTLATGLLERTRQCDSGAMNFICDTSTQRVAEIAPWCSSTAIPSDMGGSYYESDPKFEHMGPYLASVLTASECGDERLREVAGGLDGRYGSGIRLRLKGPPVTELLIALRTGRFQAVGCGADTTQCLEWQLTEEVQIRDILFLRHWYDAIESADCINCG